MSVEPGVSCTARGGPGWVGRDHSGQGGHLEVCGSPAVLSGFRDRVTSVSSRVLGGFSPPRASITTSVSGTSRPGSGSAFSSTRTAVHDAQFSQDGRWLDLGREQGRTLGPGHGRWGPSFVSADTPAQRRPRPSTRVGDGSSNRRRRRHGTAYACDLRRHRPSAGARGPATRCHAPGADRRGARAVPALTLRR